MTNPAEVLEEVGHWRTEVQIEGTVATIWCSPDGLAGHEPHWELAASLSQLHFDRRVRVVVLRGAVENEFLVPRLSGPRQPRSKEWMWRIATGTVRMHELFASLDKPVVAAVNGDAVGIGCSLMFASDLIVARQDAVIADPHMGTHNPGVVPGDGGVSLLPLFLPPALAKECLLLARPLTASQLAQLGAINYAVEASEVDAKTDELVAALIARPPDAVAWTKRVANQLVADQLRRTLDPGIAYETVNLIQDGSARLAKCRGTQEYAVEDWGHRGHDTAAVRRQEISRCPRSSAYWRGCCYGHIAGRLSCRHGGRLVYIRLA